MCVRKTFEYRNATMRHVALFMIVLMLAPSARATSRPRADQPQGSSVALPKEKAAQNPLAGMTMDQQMAVCARLADRRRQGQPLSPVMAGQAEACDRMSMAPTSMPAPAATLDR